MIHGAASDIDMGWGPGKIDVTADDVDNPVALADLRITVHQTRLHWTGNVNNGLAALAVRIERLLITSAGSAVRPPREVVMGLALHVQSLGMEAEQAGTPKTSPTSRGEALFTQNCARCHAGPTGAGAWVRVEEVATDAAAALSPMRGTGGYRVGSLHAVSDRTRLLHVAFEGSLDDLLTVDRRDALAGHAFGLDLAVGDHSALIDFVVGL